MAVYVDSMNAKFGRMIMCHMMADTTEELLEMATKIGVSHKWLQYPGDPKEHFDICLSKKKKAIALGAQEVTWRFIGELTMKRIEEANKKSEVKIIRRSGKIIVHQPQTVIKLNGKVISKSKKK